MSHPQSLTMKPGPNPDEVSRLVGAVEGAGGRTALSHTDVGDVRRHTLKIGICNAYVPVVIKWLLAMDGWEESVAYVDFMFAAVLVGIVYDSGGCEIVDDLGTTPITMLEPTATRARLLTRGRVLLGIGTVRLWVFVVVDEQGLWWNGLRWNFDILLGTAV
ncbi:hypothetical protein FPV67DRAFT_1460744 [Lyophyllum atratum]|nr:hypothetical protein FPV67DRAFT_1460744 [Lyophyllum atratum]